MAYCDNDEHVFVLGSDRSGTSLVGSILQTSSVYANYAAETKLLAECKYKYGDIRKEKSRNGFFADWFNSRQFKRSGLSRKEVIEAISEPESYIQFLGIYMGMMANKQGLHRWVDSTPDNAYAIVEIAKTFPNAKVIHVIRDGRAVSASKAKLGWSGVKTSNFDKALYYSALLWSRSINTILKSKDVLGSRYHEIRYEELVENPEMIIDQLSAFLCVSDFDKGIISGEYAKGSLNQKSPLHTPNSLYGDMNSGISNAAAYRWKKILSEKQICKVEAYVKKTLHGLGYQIICNSNASLLYILIIKWRIGILALKEKIKRHTPLGRYSVTPLEIGYD